MKTRTFLFTAIAILMLIMVMGCEKELPENTITEKGIIFYDDAVDSCGNVYMLKVIDEDNEHYSRWYKPDNLPNKYKVDNLLVKIIYSITDRTHNCGFGGETPIIIIHKISKL